MVSAASTRAPMSYRAAECSLDDFVALVEQPTAAADYPNADDVVLGAVVYQTAALRCAAADDERATRDELAHALLDGPGIIVIRGAYEAAVLDPVSAAYFSIIDEQRADNLAIGDHYGKPGANDRIWNSIEKLAMVDPAAFVEYFANDMVALACAAWLGPAYQISAQVNVVNPGGEAQRPHRDYHVGFMTDAVAEQYPAHVHRMSPMLTLQGAIAHCAMPVETGPTLYLPHSHKYAPGFLAWRRPEFIEYFDRHRVLQSGVVPRRRIESHRRCPPHGQPAAGVVGARADDGDDRLGADDERRVPGAVAARRRGDVRR
jgi:ectoine hydroxylase-related dioxygenase (phytanoyl-CoA dioxygenase family)